ncbi:MAG TPA: hypothetical protein PKO41_02460 [Dokdonella sp.]|uniref:hypothetical protein n=1 Tax=Dokdonella sp. TaxID=2291710 RepID=UPI0025B8CFC5|nr:hypothetical protein [Dokdonella sp.]MBX3690994.1 hypothetical protein [Dokdonella sp.]MCW5567827.1 hypothetical protein [Dokdonella sp.]HNR91265.1 hypothetical protein [Dokdonella sp.]
MNDQPTPPTTPDPRDLIVPRKRQADADAAAKAQDGLITALDDSALGPLRCHGEWGYCVMIPGRTGIAFDQSYSVVAHALARNAPVQRHEPLSLQIAETLHANARTILRREEIAWLNGADADFQRSVAVKLVHPDAFLKLELWPNLARLPDHLRWIGVFACLHRGARLPAVLEAAAIEGLDEAQLRQGIYRLLQARQARLELRPSQRSGAPEPATIPSPSFMQHLRARLRELSGAR